jgi:hypothetical protein
MPDATTRDADAATSGWWWMTVLCADGGFRHAIALPVGTMVDACKRLIDMEPPGLWEARVARDTAKVVGFPIPAGTVPDEQWRERLLTIQEVRTLRAWVGDRWDGLDYWEAKISPPGGEVGA